MNPHELPLEPRVTSDRSVSIKIIGLGGAGSNAVHRLKLENLEGLELAVVNTDSQALSGSPIQEKILIGSNLTRGLGAGGDPEIGREAAEADRQRLTEATQGRELVFLLAGLGGGTGGGAAPIVAELATEQDALVIAFVTLPFSFEGGRRLRQAEEALIELRRYCDAVVPLPNDLLLQESADAESVRDSFARADEWIARGVRTIWSMLFRSGLINLDFAALRQAFAGRGGKTLFGLGAGSGENAVAGAIESLRLCPLLATPESSRRTDRMLVNIVGGPDLTLNRVKELMTAVTDEFGRESHIVMGAVIDPEMSDRIEVCVLGTSDMGGRTPSRRPATSQRSRGPVAAERDSSEPPAERTRGVNGNGKAPPGEEPGNQDEFLFTQMENRGQFDKTDRNLFEGHDLDVPTYLRKGIKIVL